jgi:hypothetical protein
MLWDFFFMSFLKRKERFQNITNFPIDINSKYKQFKNNFRIIINQINLGKCGLVTFSLKFKHMWYDDARLQCIR